MNKIRDDVDVILFVTTIIIRYIRIHMICTMYFNTITIASIPLVYI